MLEEELKNRNVGKLFSQSDKKFFSYKSISKFKFHNLKKAMSGYMILKRNPSSITENVNDEG